MIRFSPEPLILIKRRTVEAHRVLQLSFSACAVLLQLRQLKNVLRPDSDLAFKRPVVASSGYASASFGNDGKADTCWTAAPDDEDAFWQVGLARVVSGSDECLNLQWYQRHWSAAVASS